MVPMKNSDEPVIVFNNVIKRFASINAVDGVTFSVAAGETVSLLGPSGCGKTTTLRLISGFEEPDGGTIEIAGESMIGKRPYERNVGLLFQHYALFPHMTVAENVAYGLKHRKWPKAEISDRVEEMLHLVRLQGFEGRRPGQLSGGQQQRVALARVLATKPKLVLLDEPLSMLPFIPNERLGYVRVPTSETREPADDSPCRWLLIRSPQATNSAPSPALTRTPAGTAGVRAARPGPRSRRDAEVRCVSVTSGSRLRATRPSRTRPAKQDEPVTSRTDGQPTPWSRSRTHCQVISGSRCRATE